MINNNLRDLSDELIKSVSRTEGFLSQCIEEEIIHNLSIELESGLETKEDRIKALRNMFYLGQIFTSPKNK